MKIARRRDDELEQWASRITAALQKTVEGIFDTGRQLHAAREKLERGKWERLFTEHRVPMTVRSAQMFIEIYKRREVLTEAKHVSCLPPSWGTLYQLARLPDDTLTWAHAQGKITPDLERRDIVQLRAEYEGHAPTPRAPSKASARPPDVTEYRTASGRLYFQIAHLLSDEFDALSPEDQDEFLTLLDQALAELRSNRRGKMVTA